ncbi:MAG: ribonuclease P protein component [Candidatus Cloacimonetes bacterium]|nr:ribonuclease P protein component [Candidatus Cloacimonadota bacterium]
MRFLTSTGDYSNVYKQNTKISGNFFISLVRQKNVQDLFAAGIIVSTKVGKAVIRNKIKRRVKAYLRENQHLHKNGVEVVFIARPEASAADWLDIKADLSKIFQKIDNEILKQDRNINYYNL